MNSLLEAFQRGGFMMYPLLICSVVLIAIVLERGYTFYRNFKDPEEILEEVKTLYKPGGDTAPAISYSQQMGAIGRIFARALKNASRPADSIEMALEQEAAQEMPVLEANLPILRTIVNISPLLGLLGTIAGMISSFQAASKNGLSNPTAILGGISEALVSTASGITIAVVGFIAYNYYANLVRKGTEDIEYYGAELVNYLTGRLD